MGYVFWEACSGIVRTLFAQKHDTTGNGNARCCKPEVVKIVSGKLEEISFEVHFLHQSQKDVIDSQSLIFRSKSLKNSTQNSIQ